ncbi:hypothetical protein GCM10027277_04740 [Pseudoduganella ginsengisoli]|nr:hypothetical protein [Pseudoduganella ginsengisoli]
MAVLTVRLLSVQDDAPVPEPASTRAASAAVALLSGAAASAPVGAAMPAAQQAGVPVERKPAPSAPNTASGRQAMLAASVESEVKARRARGEDESVVYRLRTAQLPAADVAQLMAMESAEAEWERQLAAMPSGCNAACEANVPQHVVASAYRHDATPRLTKE